MAVIAVLEALGEGYIKDTTRPIQLRDAASRRYRPGGSPRIREKAREKAYSDVYPTLLATASIESCVSRKRRAARSIRQRVK